jgi:uncharacterized protein YkwD
VPADVIVDAQQNVLFPVCQNRLNRNIKRGVQPAFLLAVHMHSVIHRLSCTREKYAMARLPRLVSSIVSVLAAAILAGCGGGGDNGPQPAVAAPAQISLAQEPNAPQLTGNIATDGFNWFNYRRQQMGLAAVERNSILDTAAQNHSDYQKLNGVITHDEIPGKPGFTGATTANRLSAAGNVFNQSRYAYGEVISATGDTSGFDAADGLITAIYHRFVIFEPAFRQAGAGVGSVPNGYTYFTVDFAANGLGPGVGPGRFVNYPFANQQHVPVVFFSKRETPDPVPDLNEVGYPVSIHADITAVVDVQSFTLTTRGGAPLPVRLLSHATDANTRSSAAAIIPVNVLAANTTYDVRFIGTIDGAAVSRSWSFTTQ